MILQRDTSKVIDVHKERDHGALREHIEVFIKKKLKTKHLLAMYQYQKTTNI